MKLAILALALAAALPMSAQAGEVDYTYGELSYINSDWVGQTDRGWALGASVDFAENFYGNINYSSVDSNDIGLKIDETLINIGYHHAMSEKADFIAELGYVNYGLDLTGFGSDSANGYRGAIGVRGMIAPKFEGNIRAYYTKVNDFGDGDFGARVGGVFKVNESWGITASYDHNKLGGDNINTWGIGVRAGF